MKIGVIQAGSQSTKNALIYEAVREYAPAGSEVIDLGCYEGEDFSYIEVSVLIGMLLGSGACDFIVTGCSSGQGMMLACNNMPGVLCGYVPSPRDAYLFAQINDGNAVSLPLGEDYTWSGSDNLRQTIEALFSEPFGQGYPKSEAERKLKDTAMLKHIRRLSQISMPALLRRLDRNLIEKLLTKRDVIGYILGSGDNEITALIREMQDAYSFGSYADDEISAIRERAVKAAKGPWKAYAEGRDMECGSSFIRTQGEDIELIGASVDDLDFIAHARQDIPYLLDKIERLRPADMI